MRKANMFFFVGLMAMAITLFITGCQGGTGMEEIGPHIVTGQQDIDFDGTPDDMDVCPGDYNPADTPVGGGIACVAIEDCYQGGVLGSANLSNGQPVPIACNNLGCAQVGINCLEGQCLMQADLDMDGAGDVCDDDDDNDRVADVIDNCPTVPNTDQLDTDDDGAGNVCDDDDDGDGINDEDDNCWLVDNPTQTDTDGDCASPPYAEDPQCGDACVDDADGDGVDDEDDNCPLTVNPPIAGDDSCTEEVEIEFQLDTDCDGMGDECDEDDDDDGDLDVTDCEPLDPAIFNGQDESCNGLDDNCDEVVDEGFTDTDTDGEADCVDTDDDNDGIDDVDDNCPLTINPDQYDTDGDGDGDVCDSDLDGDGVENVDDNCVYWSNPDQSDVDIDGLGDPCDTDCDGDGIDEVQPSEFPNPCDGDLDGDGFLTPEDCLEGNGDVYPGAPELCNGVDDDCDTVTDNDVIDCAVGEACIDGACVPQECTGDGDCAIGEACIDGVCVCQPQCGGLECGDDGCGGSCGTCAEGDVCNAGLCETPPECTVNGDCAEGEVCSAGSCVPENQCVVDGDCGAGEFCAGGLCAGNTDQHGRTGSGQSGADAGPWPDGTPDQWDDDGDCYCDISPSQAQSGFECLGSEGSCGQLFNGDCDDTPTGAANHPGATDWPGDNYDNDCDGTVDE